MSRLSLPERLTSPRLRQPQISTGHSILRLNLTTSGSAANARDAPNARV